MKAAVDASILVKIVLEADVELLRRLHGSYDLHVPMNALEEAAYVVLRESVEEEHGASGRFDVKGAFEAGGSRLAETRLKALLKVTGLARLLAVEWEDFRLSLSLVSRYRLLTNDALTAAVAMRRGLALVTADEDYRRLEGLQVVMVG